MRFLLRQYRLYFASWAAAGLVLRLFFFFRFPNVSGDALFYGDLAKNWLQYGVLGTSGPSSPAPSLIRLPGYPAFLAAVWAITGVEHYRTVLLIQALVSLATCFVVAGLAWRTLHSAGAAKLAFLLAALCPFTANYAACVLTETLAIFFTALALERAAAALEDRGTTDDKETKGQRDQETKRPGDRGQWAFCGAAVGAGILLRPDGGILLAVIVGYLLYLAAHCWPPAAGNRKPTTNNRQLTAVLLATVLVSALALAPLVPWTIRNWRTFHVFQPLAPRYANAPGESAQLGFIRWTKTWMADYVSVAEIWFAAGDDELDISKLPARAFDTPEERARTAELFNAYNATPNKTITPDLDAQFGGLARARIHRHPLRYYVELPALRITSMWLRPRTEMVGLTDRWWEVEDDPSGCAIAMALGAINLFYVGAALWGIWKLRFTIHDLRFWAAGPLPAKSKIMDGQPMMWGLLLAFVVARSLFLGSIESPEPRYMLECYPAIIVFASALGVRKKCNPSTDK
jgi:hypothetical protein